MIERNEVSNRGWIHSASYEKATKIPRYPTAQISRYPDIQREPPTTSTGDATQGTISSLTHSDPSSSEEGPVPCTRQKAPPTNQLSESSKEISSTGARASSLSLASLLLHHPPSLLPPSSIDGFNVEHRRWSVLCVGGTIRLARDRCLCIRPPEDVAQVPRASCTERASRAREPGRAQGPGTHTIHIRTPHSIYLSTSPSVYLASLVSYQFIEVAHSYGSCSGSRNNSITSTTKILGTIYLDRYLGPRGGGVVVDTRASNSTWQQRYYVNASYWNPDLNGPVFRTYPTHTQHTLSLAFAHSLVCCCVCGPINDTVQIGGEGAISPAYVLSMEMVTYAQVRVLDRDVSLSLSLCLC